MTATSEIEQLVSEDSSPFLTDPLILPLRLKPACFDTSNSTASTNIKQCQDHADLQLRQAKLRIKNLEAALASTQKLASTRLQHTEEVWRFYEGAVKEARTCRDWNKLERESATRCREEAARQREEARKYREEAARCEEEAIQSQRALASIQSENFKLKGELIDLRHPMPLSSPR